MANWTPGTRARRARIAVFASGRGSNLGSLMSAYPRGADRAVAMVISDQAAAPALERARKAGLAAYHIQFPKGGREAFERQAAGALAVGEIDLVCLAGFMRILSAEFVRERFGRILNVHPALLPDFPGLDPQRRVLEAGLKVSGCTIHFVDEGTDTGPIVAQARVPILPGDSEVTLSERILAAEHRLYPMAVGLVLDGISRPVP